jgi:hypothetical protein
MAEAQRPTEIPAWRAPRRHRQELRQSEGGGEVSFMQGE